MSNNSKSTSTSEVLTKSKVKIDKPKLYKVILLNDDYTPMEYVVKLLKSVFRKSESEAINISYHFPQNLLYKQTILKVCECSVYVCINQ